MRPILAAFVLGAFLTPCARAADLHNFGDAPLHAVQFVDADEGWTVGDEGVVWHTLDGGQSWERQPTGTRASLRSLHFLNPYTGWVVGREELPYGGGSAGVLLFTQDGGCKWRQVHLNALPGLNRIRFLDNTSGFALGDGTEQFPTGVFQTTDSGRTWNPVPGPRCPAWLAGDFRDPQNGALAGAWNSLAFIRDGNLVMARVDLLGGRSVTALQLYGKRGVAVGQGGLVLLDDGSAGTSWSLPKLNLPADVLAALDFRAVACAGRHIWVAGRPGSVVLHSGDAGNTWELLPTGQPLPLHGLHFVDEQHGWAVGEFGVILGTSDGGKSWRLQRRGGEHAAALFVHARGASLPVETLAALGGEDGFLTAALRVVASDPASASPARASEAQRFAAAVRQSGGGAGEMLWQFPVPQHQLRSEKGDLIKGWDRLHGDRGADQMLRQLVLALRIWQPEVIVTDHPDVQATGFPVDALVVEAIRESFQRAADPKEFPEQIALLGLKPCKAAKLYASWSGGNAAQVAVDATEISHRLQASLRDFATPAAGLLQEAPAPLPDQRRYRLLETRLDGAESHRGLMEGIVLGPGGMARRDLGAVPVMAADLHRALQTRRTLELLAEKPAGTLNDPNRLLGQVGPALAGMPQDQAAAAAFGLASQYVRQGQWTLARELFLLMVDRYPAHPLSAEAYRWLIRHNSSSEARHRHELGQFLAVTTLQIHAVELAAPPAPAPTEAEGKDKDKQKPPYPNQVSLSGKTETEEGRQVTLLADSPEMRQWYRGSLEVTPRLAAFGRLYATDPATLFCLQASRRNLGDFEGPRQWYARFATEQPSGPWHDAATAELWLQRPSGPPPKPIFACRATDAHPFLDGKLDDACWQGVKPVLLQNAVGKTLEDYPTEVWMAYDQEYLYLALRCRHPADRHVDPVRARPRDADLRPYDRVTLMLDLDRDYCTTFNLHVDQRGCVCDDCWGDLTWNPKWFVALHSEPTCWQVEAAIPLNELTADLVKPNRVWACNVVRVLPGRGVQAFSVPADVQPRPEGMGLLQFGGEQPQPAIPGALAPVPRVP